MTTPLTGPASSPRRASPRALRLATALLVALAARASASRAAEPPAVAARNWVDNASVDRDTAGWRADSPPGTRSVARWDAHGGRHGSGALNLANARRDTLSEMESAPGWRFRVEGLPTARRYHWSAWVRCDSCRIEPAVGVVLANDNTVAPAVDVSSTEGDRALRGSYDWRRVEGDVKALAGVTKARFMLMLPGGGDAWFDDFSLVDVGPAGPAAVPAWTTAPIDSAYLFMVRNDEDLLVPTPETGPGATPLRVRLALPRADAHQVPVGLDLWVEPKACLRSTSFEVDSLGNPIADLVLDPSLGVPSERSAGRLAARIQWRAAVLVPPEDLSAIPAHARIPAAWPAEAQPWLAASPCVQSDDPLIRATARRLGAGTRDEVEIVGRVLTFMDSLWTRSESHPLRFDALSAMSANGSCLSNANLVAALLRASGIPARTLAGVQTGDAPTGVHLIVESWVDGHGWTRIESTLYQAPLPAWRFIVNSIASPAAEARGATPRAGAAHCLHWLAGAEILGPCRGCGFAGRVSDDGAGQIAHRLDASYAGPDAARWRAIAGRARARWQDWLRSGPAPASDGHLRTPFQAQRLADLPGD